jgi:aldose 1-epimerase
MSATTTAPTIVNIVHHSYVNLAGHDAGDILGHTLQMHAGYYTPVDDELLPTGEIAPVAGTPFDFRRPKRIGADLGEVSNAAAGRTVAGATGYDHNWVFDEVPGPVLTLTDPVGGRRLELSTDQPGVQLYTGGYLAGVSAKKPLTEYAAFAGLTLETQTFPDAPNLPHFPSPVLRPGEEYVNTMSLRFSTVP